MCLLRGTFFVFNLFHVNFSSIKGQVRSQVNPREIYATDTGFLQGLGFPVSLSFHQCGTHVAVTVRTNG